MAHWYYRVISPFGALVFFVCLLFPTTFDATTELYSENGEPYEQQFFREVSECTTGLASCAATPDGRPLLWKNRDVGNGRQEYHYRSDFPIPFIGLTYSGDTTEYYAGMNAAGFSVENSDATNLDGQNPFRNGWGFGPEDGELMLAALATCTTVEDFQKLLDSLNVDGHTSDHNYGVFDAYGGAAMFEVDGYKYARYDAMDSPGGWLVRSNYSYSGFDGMKWVGYSAWRHDRAYQLWKEGWTKKNLTAQYILSTVARDLMPQGCVNYSIPYEDYYNNVYGVLPNGDDINRSYTRSMMVSHGVAAGQRADDGVIWAMIGNPVGGIATPLWVRAGSVPVEYDNPDDRQYARLCGLSAKWENWATTFDGVDTRKLKNADRTGYWDYVLGLENWEFQKVDRFVSSPHFSYDQLAAFQNNLAKQMADSLELWAPPTTVTEIVEPVVKGDAIVIAWGKLENPPGPAGRGINGYIVYRSPDPFRDGVTGEKIATVAETRFVDINPLPHGAFYRVEAVFD